MTNHRSNRRVGLLGALHSWRASTVPVAILLMLVQSLYVSVLQAQTANAQVQIVTEPAPPGATGGLQASDPDPYAGYGRLTAIGENASAPVPSPDVQTPGPRVSKPTIDPERKREILVRARAEYHHFSRQAGASEGAVTSRNLTHQLDLNYGEGGMAFTPTPRPTTIVNPIPPEPGWMVGFRSQSVEFDGEAILLGRPVSPGFEEGRTSSVLGAGVEEWYVNRLEGVEHGYTIGEAGLTGNEAPQQLAIAIEVETELSAVMNPEDESIVFRSGNGRTKLVYRDLHVFDRTGRELISAMRLVDGPSGLVIRLMADIAGAEFPLTVDPTVFTQKDMILADGGAPGHEFGTASDGLGKVVAVSAPLDGSGSVRLFHQDHPANDQWGEKATTGIPATESPDPGDRFGDAVALLQAEGSPEMYLAVGATNHGGCGAVFIYRRDQGGVDNWGFVEKLQPSDLTGGDLFGCAIDAQDTRLIVGAKSHNAKGAVYVFELGGGSFGQDQKLSAPQTVDHTPVAGDMFGAAVGLGANTLIVGAPGEKSMRGGAYVFQSSSPFSARYRVFSDKSEPGSHFGLIVAIALTGLWFAIGSPFDDHDFGGGLLTDVGSLFVYAFIGGLLTFITAKFGPAAGAFFGLYIVMNYFNDMLVSAPGAGVGGLAFLFLFSALIGTFGGFEPPDTITPQGFNDPGMFFGLSMVMLGTLLFIMAARYNLNMGGMYIITAAVVALGLIPLTFGLWRLLWWTQSEIDQEPVLTGPFGDPDKDGLNNRMEFLLGLFPLLFNVNPFGGKLGPDGVWRMFFTQSLAATGAILLLLYGFNLQTWFLFGTGILAGLLQVQTKHAGLAVNLVVVSILTVLALQMYVQLNGIGER